jgi:hypothetical protein
VVLAKTRRTLRADGSTPSRCHANGNKRLHIEAGSYG